MTKCAQLLLTVGQGKSLISLALAKSDIIRDAIENHTLVVVAGSTNAYLAKYILDDMGLAFEPVGFRRGANVAPGEKPPTGPFANTDVVIRRGEWLRDRTIFDIADELTQGDVIVKGANALQPDRKVAGIQIGHPKFGTIGPILQAVMGRRVRFVIPIGLEKRVESDITELASMVNGPDATGPRLQPVTGDVVTEIEAIAMLTGARATLLAAGGIGGAQGSITLFVRGDQEQLDRLKACVDGLITIA